MSRRPRSVLSVTSRIALATVVAALGCSAFAPPSGAQAPVSPAESIYVTGTSEVETTAASFNERGIPVYLGGREVFRVRAGRSGFDPEQRAVAIRHRIERAVSDPALSPDSVAVIRTSEGYEVRAGHYFLWAVLPGDLEVATAGQLPPLPADYAQKVRSGLSREREARRPARLAVSAGIAVGLLLLFVALTRLLGVVGRAWRGWLAGHVVPLIPSWRPRGFEVVPRAQLEWLLLNSVGRIWALAGLAALYGIVTFAFSLFPWTDEWSPKLGDVAYGTLAHVGRGILRVLPDLAVIVAVLWISSWLRTISDRFFKAVEDGAMTIPGIHPELAEPTRKLARIFIWVITLVVVYPYIPGSSSRAVQGVTLLLGAMVSLGATGLVGNVLAGLVLTYARSFRVGERVRIGDHIGEVLEVGTFATKIRSLRNEEITIPNGTVASQPILNYSRLAKEGLRLQTGVTIGYDAPWRQVHALLLEAASSVKGIVADPPPRVYQRSLNDFHISYDLYAVTHDAHDQLRLYSDLHAAIQDSFARAGVEILSPAFSNLRDANAPILPDDPAGPRAEPGGFRIRSPRP